MKSGTTATRWNHKDRDLHRSFGNTVPQQFPNRYFVSYAPAIPDQDAEGEPSGCTNYSSARLANVLTKGTPPRTAQQLEMVTHANAQGGFGVRESLLAAKGLGWFKGFYQLRASGGIDSFDALRLGLIAGLPEERAISLGTPWCPSWEDALHRGVCVLPMPTPDELTVIHREAGTFGSVHKMRHSIMRFFGSTLPQVTWHNSVIEGFEQQGGYPALADASWQGTLVGDRGYVYFTREVINVILGLNGTVAFVGTNQTPQTILPVDSTAVQWIVSLFRNIFHM